MLSSELFRFLFRVLVLIFLVLLPPQIHLRSSDSYIAIASTEGQPLCPSPLYHCQEIDGNK